MVLEYDDAASAQMEAMYMGHDVVAQRRAVVTALAVQPGEHVIDIGAGPGFLATEIAAETGPTGRVLGVDISEDILARARSRNTLDHVAYVHGSATDLPVEDASFDVAVSTQVAEYMTDAAPYCAEVARILKPGGRALILTTDWDGVIWHSADPARMARVMDAANRSVAQTQLPRRIAPLLRDAGLTLANATCFPIVNTDLRPGNFATGYIGVVEDFIRSEGTIPEPELTAWLDEQHTLARTGRFFCAVGRFIFQVVKPA